MDFGRILSTCGRFGLSREMSGGSMPNYYLNGGQPLDPAKILSGTTTGSLSIYWVAGATPLVRSMACQRSIESL
jgi:hypothetical protein